MCSLSTGSGSEVSSSSLYRLSEKQRLVKLCECAVSPEPLLFAYVISAFFT